jgi:hypothetical protein
LYIYYHPYIVKCHKLLMIFQNIGEGKSDIISYSLNLLFKKMVYFQYRKDNFFNFEKISKYHPYKLTSIYRNKYYNLFITFLPIIFLLIECILNNFSIKYIYYFLVFYIPIILLRRITSFLCYQAYFIIKIINDLYYNSEKNLIYAINPDLKSLFDLYLLNDLVSYDSLDADFQLNLSLTIKFHLYNKERNVYINDLACLSLIHNNKNSYSVFEEIEKINENNDIIYSLGKEWILLAKK